MSSHALYTSGERDAKDRVVFVKPYLFLLNNLYAIQVYLKERGVNDAIEHVNSEDSDVEHPITSFSHELDMVNFYNSLTQQ